MKVTAFHMANKVEEAVRSHLLNSFVFSNRKIDVERTADFRNNISTLQFFLRDGDERVPMGGMEFVQIADTANKVALQCRCNVLPADISQQFFLILPSDAEQYAQYTRLAELLHKQWDKDVNAYLPKNEEIPQVAQEAPKSLDDEYASLSPEEIEEITGVKQAPKTAKAVAMSPAAAMTTGDLNTASENEIKRLMGMMMGEPAAQPGAHGVAMSMEEIEALAREVSQNVGKEAPAKAEPAPVAVAKKAEEPEAQMSAEDIWRQINGGK
jgi:hypothetical protein